MADYLIRGCPTEFDIWFDFRWRCSLSPFLNLLVENAEIFSCFRRLQKLVNIHNSAAVWPHLRKSSK